MAGFRQNLEKLCISLIQFAIFIRDTAQPTGSDLHCLVHVCIVSHILDYTDVILTEHVEISLMQSNKLKRLAQVEAKRFKIR